MADWTDTQLPENIMTTLEVDDLAVNYDISAGTVYSKNSCTAWVLFDGTTTPPTIFNSFNVSDVVRVSLGVFDVYFVDMDNSNYSVVSGVTNSFNRSVCSIESTVTKTQVDCRRVTDGSLVDEKIAAIVFGGKE
jgi:hypothetical protein